MKWKLLFMLISGKELDDEIYKIIDYIVEENRVYRKRLGPLKNLTHPERMRLGELVKKIKRKHRDSDWVVRGRTMSPASCGCVTAITTHVSVSCDVLGKLHVFDGGTLRHSLIKICSI